MTMQRLGAATPAAATPAVTTPAAASGRPTPLVSGEISLFRVTGLPSPPDRHIGTVTGDLRRIRCADVWVNPENTEMIMARWEERSISSVIRYEGALRDDIGRITEDLIADELSRKVAGRRPVPPGTAIVTGAGELHRFMVRNVVHVAAVQGEPGAGFRQVRDVGRCVTNVMVAVDGIDADPPPRTILFPLLGTGQGGGELEPTIKSMVGAAVDYLSSTSRSRITAVFLQAYTDIQLQVCTACFTGSRRLAAATGELGIV